MQNKSIIAMGYIETDNNENVTEVLGNWFSPFTLLCILVFYFWITALLKFKKSINFLSDALLHDNICLLDILKIGAMLHA